MGVGAGGGHDILCGVGYGRDCVGTALIRALTSGPLCWGVINGAPYVLGLQVTGILEQLSALYIIAHTLAFL